MRGHFQLGVERTRVTILSHCLGGNIGQAFVELALVLPIFIILLVGAAELGRLAYAAIEVNNAARAGVAYASQSHTTAGDTGTSGGIVLAAQADAPNITDLTATATQTCACESTAGVLTSADCSTISTAAGSCPSPSRIQVFVQVNTSAPIATLFHLPGIPSSLTLKGQASMRVVQ